MQDAGPFYRRQVERCSELGIDAGALPVSHLAVRTRTWREYLVLRDEFEERSVANLEDFSRRHRAVLTGQKFQSSEVEPVYILFDDYTHVKFHQRSLKDACELEGRAFVGFQHVDWHPPDELAG